jgi:hypothetical protein
MLTFDLQLSVPGSNKILLVGMQLPGKNKEKFDVSSKGPLSGVSSVGQENYCT